MGEELHVSCEHIVILHSRRGVAPLVAVSCISVGEELQRQAKVTSTYNNRPTATTSVGLYRVLVFKLVNSIGIHVLLSIVLF